MAKRPSLTKFVFAEAINLMIFLFGSVSGCSKERFKRGTSARGDITVCHALLRESAPQ